MKKSKTLKSLTLFSFVILLTGFITFKTGTFDKYLKTDSEVEIRENKRLGNSESMQVDTPSVKTVDTTRFNPTMLSTSKSGIVIDQKIKFSIEDALKHDSTKLTPKK